MLTKSGKHCGAASKTGVSIETLASSKSASVSDSPSESSKTRAGSGVGLEGPPGGGVGGAPPGPNAPPKPEELPGNTT